MCCTRSLFCTIEEDSVWFPLKHGDSQVGSGSYRNSFWTCSRARHLAQTPGPDTWPIGSAGHSFPLNLSDWFFFWPLFYLCSQTCTQMFVGRCLGARDLSLLTICLEGSEYCPLPVLQLRVYKLCVNLSLHCVAAWPSSSQGLYPLTTTLTVSDSPNLQKQNPLCLNFLL